MKKFLRYKSYPEPTRAKPDAAELIVGIQQQLISLEKKVDTLIGRSANRPFEERRRSYGEARQGGDRGQRTLYKAVCADCDEECEVPFRPSQDRPVYCKDCFSERKKRGSFKVNQDNGPAERDISPERNFDKPPGAANQGRAVGKRPFLKKKKNKKR